MNTIRSTWYGWGTLCVAGGGAYYFAKQQINADRAARYNKERQKQERLHRLESRPDHTDTPVSKTRSNRNQADSENTTHNTKGSDSAGSPSSEASADNAAVAHSLEEKPRARSKYEGEPFKSKKGDRFS